MADPEQCEPDRFRSTFLTAIGHRDVRVTRPSRSRGVRIKKNRRKTYAREVDFHPPLPVAPGNRRERTTEEEADQEKGSHAWGSQESP